MSKLRNIRIDIVSDVVCPWCIIGYRRLEEALGAFEGKINVELYWQPFQINPDMPSEGENLGEHLTKKYGLTSEQSQANRENLIQIGESLDFTFNFTPEFKIYNTFKAHQLLHWAAKQGRQHALKLALFTAYFTEQKDPSDIELLVTTAMQVGLDGEEARAVLTDERFADDVKMNQQTWTNSGIQSVPSIVLDQKYLISGAQDPETFIQSIQQVLNDAR